MLSNCNLDFRERRTIVRIPVCQFNSALRQWPKDKGTPSTSRNLQKANRPSIEKPFSKATMECSWSYWSCKSGMFQRCSTVEFSDPRGKTKAEKPINSLCWMWISCDSQEHHWISTTTTPMWDQFGSTQNPETASYSYYVPGWGRKSCQVAQVLSYPAHILEWWADFVWIFQVSGGREQMESVIQDDTRYLGVVWCVKCKRTSMILLFDHPTFREDDDLRLLWKFCLHLFLKRVS